MLRRRVFSALIMLPLVGLIVYYGGIALFIGALLVALLAMQEYLRLLTIKDISVCQPLGLVFVAALVADGYWSGLQTVRWTLLLCTLLLLVLQVFRQNAPGSLFSWSSVVAGAIYIGLPLSYFVKLRESENGLLWLTFALVGTWVSDTGAYLIGTWLGRHKLCPSISPKKTWEGLGGGLLGALVVSVAGGMGFLGLNARESIVLGIALFFAATFGDLAESVIKRQAGVKDSSRLIPGHGGMLDRIDSLLFVVPVVYYFAALLSA